MTRCFARAGCRSTGRSASPLGKVEHDGELSNEALNRIRRELA
jgi:hypothetical protein